MFEQRRRAGGCRKICAGQLGHLLHLVSCDCRAQEHPAGAGGAARHLAREFVFPEDRYVRTPTLCGARVADLSS